MYKNILLSLDLQDPESCKKPLDDAIGLAQAVKATLHVITVVPDYGMSIVGSFFPKGHEKTLIESALQKLHEFTDTNIPKDLAVQRIVGHGTVYEEVLRVAAEIDIDIIIMGASRPMAGKFLLGPNAANVARHADCSVLVSRV